MVLWPVIKQKAGGLIDRVLPLTQPRRISPRLGNRPKCTGIGLFTWISDVPRGGAIAGETGGPLHSGSKRYIFMKAIDVGIYLTSERKTVGFYITGFYPVNLAG